jgi:hypothetical protein
MGEERGGMLQRRQTPKIRNANKSALKEGLLQNGSPNGRVSSGWFASGMYIGVCFQRRQCRGAEAESRNSPVSCVATAQKDTNRKKETAGREDEGGGKRRERVDPSITQRKGERER